MEATASQRDTFYRAAKQEGWRARSAFKLIQVADHFRLFDNVTRVVDLCAAPGSWSQVCAQRLSKVPNSAIVAVDLQPMAPIPGVIQIRGDITSKETAQQVIDAMNGKKADLVISDGAPDVTGLHDLDEYMQSQLVFSAFNIACFMLREGGTFMAKIFTGRDIQDLYSSLSPFFETVTAMKPRASRVASLESFVVCQGFKLPEGYTPILTSDPQTDFEATSPLSPSFVAFGDLSGFDKAKDKIEW
ncbi:cell division protein, putative [Trichomonas vaginalis G3]|uniref:Putative tRNA (cytidine(32)/guanosine(34)-2'-O)-methyltransferase n=1 Tax=Trichomonas vaginalis (strain ATCC PRA-98 / G3) TaxID=412133 RepID=A2F7C6_TRIV3|nr:tRNA methyltransferase protein [Trichomonas vaginalis G3]EAX99194.1 cell division protein, putative [Trichomonas vaginalis G3]KAI5487967.1 tRNA methyltransferase protein [Trichomonas vaginalis G3]|eukprot:XP_001312124.1 cell division protein [Trichomonas vaginalis G3]